MILMETVTSSGAARAPETMVFLRIIEVFAPGAAGIRPFPGNLGFGWFLVILVIYGDFW